MDNKNRKTGIKALGDVCWGTHICVFYWSISDLIDLVVPFLRAGLESNELCIWSISEGLEVNDAETILSKRIKDLSGHIRKGQLKIIDSIYEKSGKFEPEKVKLFWIKEEEQALKSGFDGIRITGSGNWAKKTGWQELHNYEKDVDNIIKSRKIIAACTYSNNMIALSDTLSVAAIHSTGIIKSQEHENVFEPNDANSILEHLNRMGR